MIYLASPYTEGKGKEDAEVRQRRYELAKKFCASNIEQHIYSPIVHYHEMAADYDLPKDFDFWKMKNYDMIRRCDAVWVLDVPNEPDWNWDKSKGVTAEGSMAMQLGIKVHRTPFYAEDRPMPRELTDALAEAEARNAAAEEEAEKNG